MSGTNSGGGLQGLPPLPKSLTGLLSIGRESLSKAEATLGQLRTTASTAANPETPPPSTTNTPPTAAPAVPTPANQPAPPKPSNPPTYNNVGPRPTNGAPKPGRHLPQIPTAKQANAPSKGAVVAAAEATDRPGSGSTNPSGFQQYSSLLAAAGNGTASRQAASPSPFRPIQSPGPRTYQNIQQVKPAVNVATAPPVRPNNVYANMLPRASFPRPPSVAPPQRPQARPNSTTFAEIKQKQERRRESTGSGRFMAVEAAGVKSGGGSGGVIGASTKLVSNAMSEMAAHGRPRSSSQASLISTSGSSSVKTSSLNSTSSHRSSPLIKDASARG